MMMNYPSRCQRTHAAAAVSPTAEGYVCGRIAALDASTVRIVDESGYVELALACSPAGAAPGDIVELAFSGGAAHSIRILARSAASPAGNADVRRFDADLRTTLRRRALLLAQIRTFFTDQGFLEVETPALVRSPGLEPHLRGFATRYEPEDGSTGIDLFLPTSPEYHMKRLLAAGFEKIFQLCRSFRNGECYHLHNPEFAMLEWYRAYADADAIMRDLETLGARLAAAAGGGPPTVQRAGREINFAPPWERITVSDAFRRLAGIELPPEGRVVEFRAAATSAGVAGITEADGWDDVFYKVFLSKIEPRLGWERPVFLTEYPASMAALAKVKESNPAVAERFELYIGGVEIANGFTELNDPAEQRRRFHQEAETRRRLSAPHHPIDEHLLAALAAGMPPAGGVAVGVDRLVMVLLGKTRIEDVIAFPFAHDFPPNSD